VISAVAVGMFQYLGESRMVLDRVPMLMRMLTAETKSKPRSQTLTTGVAGDAPRVEAGYCYV
jgi:hypothetical protein